MNSAQIIADQYETQYFGVSGNLILESYADALKWQCESSTKGALEKVKNKLLPCTTNSQALEAVFEEVTQFLTADYDRGVDYAVQKIGSQLKECFRIPDGFVCEEDTAVVLAQDIDSEKLDQDIEDLKQRLRNLNFMAKNITQEISKAEEAIATVETVKNLTASLSSPVLSTHLTFV